MASHECLREKELTALAITTAENKIKLDTIHIDIQELNKKVGIQNGRVFKLEKWQAYVFGICSLAGAITTIFGIIPLWLKH